MIGQLLLYAQDATGSVLDFLDFANLGVLAVLVVGLIKGWVVPAYVLDAEIAEKETLRQELMELRSRLDKEVLPQLWRTTDLLARFANMEENRRSES